MEQRCELKQFIAIKMISQKWMPGFLPQSEQGRAQDSRETEIGRDRALLDMKDSVSNKIDCWRKTFVMNMCD